MKISISKQDSLVNWFKKQNILIKLEIFKEKKNQFYKLKSIDADIDKELLDYISLLKAIEKLNRQEEYLKKKNKNMTIENIKSISNIEIIKLRKARKRKKYEQVLNRWSIVTRLRTESVSWRGIEEYFLTKYKIKISHQWLRHMYININEGKEVE
ncbi:hypothetical protein [Poseidonibacter ostreae]|nr:hypothetical protein [Poseidonibacter ostreae]